jgi:hypothetical protein
VIANSFCWYEEVCRTTECTGGKKKDSKRLNPSPKTQNFARESPTLAKKRRGIGVEVEERKASLLMTPAEKRVGSRGQSADPGRELEASNAFFPIPIVPSFHSPRLRSLQTHYRRLRFSHFCEPELSTGVVLTEITVKQNAVNKKLKKLANRVSRKGISECTSTNKMRGRLIVGKSCGSHALVTFCPSFTVLC